MALPTQRCRFLEIPREIRDVIYGFALSYEQSLCGDVYPNIVARYANENSPLRHICHQTSAETQNLLLKVNDTITFASIVGVAGLSTFLDLAPRMRSPYWKNMTRINIYTNTSVPASAALDAQPFSTERIFQVFRSTDFADLEAYCTRNLGVRAFLHFKAQSKDMDELSQSYNVWSQALKMVREVEVKRPTYSKLFSMPTGDQIRVLNRELHRNLQDIIEINREIIVKLI
jgi:hypothetical protein